MATYTREDFVRQVLVELGVLDATEAPAAEDAVTVNQKTDQKFEELYEDGLIPFDIDGDIPARYFLPLLSIVAAESATGYGKSGLLPVLGTKANEGVRRLWKLRQKPYEGTVGKATYF